MNKLLVLWKTDNLIDIEEMVLPYIYNSKKRKWWDDIHVIIWGASQKAVSENEFIKIDVKAMVHDGIKIFACKACADNICVTDHLEDLGVDVIYTGELLTKYLQDDEFKVLTF